MDQIHSLLEQFEWMDGELKIQVYSELEGGWTWLTVAEETEEAYNEVKEFLKK